MRSLALVLALILAAAATPAGAAPPPFVGCASDGQQGPQPPPTRPERLPDLPPAVAARLALYASRDLAVLAPRGWRCIALEGSSGSFLMVTPERHTADDFMSSDATSTNTISGPAVQLAYSLGGTSGRYAVAEIAPAYFPAARAFARDVAREMRAIGGVAPKAAKRAAADRLISLSSTEAVVETPAKRRGLGTRSQLSPGARPITTLAILLPEPDMDLVLANVRVGDPVLTRAILDEVRRAYRTAAP